MQPTRLVTPFVLISALSLACGKATPSHQAGTGPGPGGAGPAAAAYDPVALWAPVMKEGATYQFDDSGGEPGASDVTVVTATVIKVTRDEAGTTAELTWADGGGNDVTGSLPRHVRVHGGNVWFSDDALFDADDTVAFPPPGPETQAGLYTHASAEGVCYGTGPGPDADDCPDVCFAELCVAPGRGLVGGAGTWWPGYGVFASRAP